MQVNRYSQAADIPFISTYVPIDFDTMYRIGTAQKQAVDDALKDLSTNLKTWGEFTSPSVVDTDNWYKLTMGQMAPIVNEMVKNPDLIKSAEGRYRLQNAINNVDYASLSKLKQSSDFLRQGLEMRAKMKADGTYNEDWDLSDIEHYDTLGRNQVFSDIAPVKFMTANQLSNPYFDNMAKGDLGPVWQNGILYRVKGNTIEDLYQVATQHFNDLVNTPQGQKYMQQFIKQTGNKDDARKAFINMIAQSQIDRTIRPELEVDPAFMLRLKYQLDGAGKPTYAIPTRQQKIDRGIYGTTKDILQQASSQDIERYNTLSNQSDTFSKAIDKLVKQYQSIKGTDAQSESKREELALKIAKFQKHRADTDNALNGLFYKNKLNNEFKNITNTEVKNANKIEKADYNRGVRGALNSVASTTAVYENDPMLTLLHGIPNEYVQENGTKDKAYTFNSSVGFLLPETVFQLSTGTNQVDNKRGAGLLRSKDFKFRELLEKGQLGEVQFIPNGTNNTIQLGNNKMLSGKLRISKENIEKALGTGMWHDEDWFAPSSYITPFARQSTRRALEDLFNSSKIKYENGKEYYEVDIWKQLPSDDTLSYWDDVNQLHYNSTSAPSGIGSATEAAGNHPYSISSVLDRE